MYGTCGRIDNKADFDLTSVTKQSNIILSVSPLPECLLLHFKVFMYVCEDNTIVFKFFLLSQVYWNKNTTFFKVSGCKQFILDTFNKQI